GNRGKRQVPGRGEARPLQRALEPQCRSRVHGVRLLAAERNVRVTVNGIDLACQSDGPEDGPVLVLCHTLATSRAMWRRQIPHFARSHRVVSYDIRGHGESAAPDYPYSLEMLSEDVIGILD